MSQITAHAGCDGSIPGSLSGLQTAFRAGADILELDLRFFQNEILLSHDPIHPAQLSQYVRLSDVLHAFRHTSLHFNCDLKETSVFLPAIDCFSQFQLTDRLIFTGMYPFPERQPDAPYRVYPNVENIPGILPSTPLTAEQARIVSAWFIQAKQLDPHLAGLNIEYRQLSEPCLAVFAENDIALSCWGVDHLPEIQFCLAAQLENITTDAVMLACNARRA